MKYDDVLEEVMLMRGRPNKFGTLADVRAHFHVSPRILLLGSTEECSTRHGILLPTSALRATRLPLAIQHHPTSSNIIQLPGTGVKRVEMLSSVMLSGSSQRFSPNVMV